MPPNIVSFVPIILNNTQTTPTSSSYQLNLYLSVSQLSSYNVDANDQNMEYFYANGTIIPSWIEYMNNSDGGINNHTIVLLKFINSLPRPNSLLIIYMGIAPSSVNLLNNNNVGEAPQLSSTYAEYDDGANVFSFYDNFAGTTLSNIWQIHGNPIISVNDGLTINSLTIKEASITTGSFFSGIFSIDQKSLLTTNLNYGVLLDYNYSSNTGYLMRSSGYGYGGPDNITWYNDNNSTYTLLGLLQYTEPYLSGQSILRSKSYAYNSTFNISGWIRNARSSFSGLIKLPGSSSLYNNGSIGLYTANAEIFEQWVLVRRSPPNLQINFGNLE